MFTDQDGQPWSTQGPEREFLVAAYEAAGLRRKGQLWHVLRHTYASALAAGGVRRDVVERLMRHAGKGVTSLYTHLFEDAFEGVEEALDAAFGVNEASMDGGVPQVLDGHRSGPSDAPVALYGADPARSRGTRRASGGHPDGRTTSRSGIRGLRPQG